MSQKNQATPFLHVEVAEAHLGGDPFETRMIRISEDRAQAAVLRSDGALLSLREGPVGLETPPALPETAPEAAPDGGPELLTEGRGAVGLAARRTAAGELSLREYESHDPSRVQPPEAFAAFMERIEGSLTGLAPVETEGRWAQLRLLPPPAPGPERVERRLTRADLAESPLLRNLAEEPFRLFRIDPGSGDVPDWLVQAEPGRLVIVQLEGNLLGMAVHAGR